jgi:two-component system cell cycle sensor histidine kinase/response regulator CckA
MLSRFGTFCALEHMTMAMTPLGDDGYPEPILDGARSGGGLWRVLVLAVVLVLAAVVFSFYGEYIPPELVMTFMGLLAVAGVFFLFGLVAGLFRMAGGEERRTISHAVVDSLPFGALVTDRDGKISYVNAQYGSFPGALTNGVPVGVPRLFAGHSDASEAIYRLSRAAKDVRSAIEDIRIVGGLGGSQSEATRVFWYRVSVRPLPGTDGGRSSLVSWSVEDITRDKENNETAFRDLQRAIDYLDHAPSGFLSADAHGRIQYLNSTLSDWLGYDLAEFNAGHLSLSDIVRGDGSSLLMRGRGDGEIRTEIIDIDLVRRNGTTLPHLGSAPGRRGIGRNAHPGSRPLQRTRFRRRTARCRGAVFALFQRHPLCHRHA